MTTLQLFYGFLIAINLVTFFVYGADKLSAVSGAWRIRERTLLLLALFGGSPAALLAMKLFRHKTIKPTFQILLAAVLLAQIGLIYFLLKPNTFLNPTLTNPANSLY